MALIKLRAGSVPPSLHGPVLVDKYNRPRFWAGLWDGILCSAKDGTSSRHLMGVERFYCSVEASFGFDCLDQLIADQNFDAIEAALTSFLAQLQNDSRRRQVDLSDVWQSSLKFVTQTISHFGDESKNKSHEIDARLTRLSALYSQVSPNRKVGGLPIRALPSIVIEEFYEIFDPNSERNPFLTRSNKHRNYIIFLLHFEYGLRRSEALILSMSSLQSEIDFRTGTVSRWLNVINNEDEDPRYTRASLKTSTSERQIPITKRLYDAVHQYSTNYRPKSSYSQLLLSQKRRPISVQSCNDMYRIATVALSSEAKSILRMKGWSLSDNFGNIIEHGRKTWVSPHDCRHTSVIVRLNMWRERGLPLDDAVERLRPFYGWTANSSMPRLYSRAFWAGQPTLDEEERFNFYIENLREIDRIASIVGAG